MEVLRPATLAEALEARSARPEAFPIAGGTDVMVAVNFDRLRPEAFLDLSRLDELRGWHEEDGEVVLGAGLTFARIERELASLPALAQAARSVGSPQIRARGTIGGNLATASPAGDALPPLAAYEADVVLGSAARGERRVSLREFLLGPKRTSLEPDELVLAVRFRSPHGPGSFSKVGTRNAMVIAVASLCLQLDEDARAVRVAMGSVGPTVLRATEAEAFAARALAEAGAFDAAATPVPAATLREFGQLAGAAARPIDDVRGTAAYRRHAVEVLARRALSWALEGRPAGRRAAG